MIVVIDTNIIFSALLSPTGHISNVILSSPNHIQFYAPSFLKEELENHKSKILKISSYSSSEFEYLKLSLFKIIEFIDVENIKPDIWQIAYDITHKIDEDDTPFIALTLALESFLWTGDKKLIRGLKAMNFKKFIDTQELIKLQERL
ncbi:PIN domain-containing protein [Leeuwenhoekiella sp. A16]|uniref:PIN domain-containing protein n=1 Tax=unclassified Leeuwenhoekiella TaxID=2615029 RepID=UPI003A8039F0